MAKKKGRRSVNVARKREKRNRERKSRQKQLAIAKQRKHPHGKSEEDHLHACISQSRKLLDEPELEGIRFDADMMYARVIEALDSQDTQASEASEPIEQKIEIPGANKADLPFLPEPENIYEHFRLEVLPHLVTPDFMQQLEDGLKTCENRLKLTNNKELAEVAFVTRTLFEAAPPEILAFHPMIQTIGLESLRLLVEEPIRSIEREDELRELLSQVMEYEDSEETDTTRPISVFSDSTPSLEGSPHTESEPQLTAVESAGVMTVERVEPVEPVESPEETPTVPEVSVDPSDTPAPAPVIPSHISPNELPARALYKNFNGLETKQSFEGQTAETKSPNYVLVKENNEQVEFVDVANERYITVTADRLELHARSAAALTTAMAEVETQLTSTVLYLAKTIEERG